MHAEHLLELVAVVDRPVEGCRRRAGRPSTRSPSRRRRIAATNSSCTRSCTSTRVAAVQSWPALKYPAIAMPSTALAMSASSNTITGALPPSSRCTRLRSEAAARATSMPARTDPVIETICGVGCSIIRGTRRAVAGDDVEHARRQELRRDLGEQQRRLRGRVGRLQHASCCLRRSPARTSTPPC